MAHNPPITRDAGTSLLGIALILFAAISWSSAGLFTRVVTTDIPTTLFWRSIFGGFCVMGIFLAVQPRLDLRKALTFPVGELVIAALTTAGMICFISSFFFTSIANVSFVYGTMPLVTYMLALIFLRERLSFMASGCCALSAAGMAVMTLGNSELNDYVGIVLAFGMTFFMAALTVAAKFFPEADTTKAVYLSAFLVALVVAPFASLSMVTTADYIWLGLYGITNVGLGFGVYMLGVTRVTVLAAALIGLIEIPLAPIWAWLLFAEEPNALIVIGGVMIIAAAVAYTLKMKGKTP